MEKKLSWQRLSVELFDHENMIFIAFDGRFYKGIASWRLHVFNDNMGNIFSGGALEGFRNAEQIPFHGIAQV